MTKIWTNYIIFTEVMYHKKLCILIISCEFYNSQMYNSRDIEKPCVNRFY
jgi:hypothetical protein